MVTGRLPAATGPHGPRSTSEEQNFQETLWSGCYCDGLTGSPLNHSVPSQQCDSGADLAQGHML